MSTKLDFLNKIPYFSGLSTTELESISKLIVEKKADKGEMLLFEGQAARALYFINSGVIKTFKTSAEGKEQILSIVRPGESFNDVPAFDGGHSPVSAQAMSPVMLYEIGKNELETILQKYPQVILTPHIGSYTAECRKNMEMQAVNNLINAFEGCK